MNYSLILTVDDSIIVWSHNTMPLNILNSNCPLPTMRHTPCEHPPRCPTWKCHLRTTCLVAAPGQCIAALGMSLSNELCFCDPKNLVIRAGSSPTYFDVCLAASSHGPVIAVLLLEGKAIGELSQCRDEAFFSYTYLLPSFMISWVNLFYWWILLRRAYD